MSHFDEVTQKLGPLKYMSEAQAAVMRDFIRKQDSSEILEIGFYLGKSSAYIAAVLEDLGRGHLTTIDRTKAAKPAQNIFENLKTVGLSHRVTPIFAARSYTWELNKMIRQRPRPQFDLCYFDGGHTWDLTGFGFLLVDMLLKPGGWIIFDDLNWTIDKTMKFRPDTKAYVRYDDDEKAAQNVRMVFELLVPHLNYTNRIEKKGWGFAQKPREQQAIASMP